MNTSGLATCVQTWSVADTVEVEITRVLKDGKRIQAATMSATITVESTFIPCEIRQVILQPRSYVTGNGPWQETRWAAAINVILVWKLDMRTPNYRMRYAFNGSQPTWDMGVGPDEYYTFYTF